MLKYHGNPIKEPMVSRNWCGKCKNMTIVIQPFKGEVARERIEKLKEKYLNLGEKLSRLKWLERVFHRHNKVRRTLTKKINIDKNRLNYFEHHSKLKAKCLECQSGKVQLLDFELPHIKPTVLSGLHECGGDIIINRHLHFRIDNSCLPYLVYDYNGSVLKDERSNNYIEILQRRSRRT